jgi:RNA polymerase sigma factor (sigma-70 family)
LFNLEDLTQNNSMRVVASRQLTQRAVDIQRDVYDSHRHRVFALAFYMSGNEIEAEEILTATFVKAFRCVAVPDGGQVDSALVEELRLRFPLDQSEANPEIQSAANDKGDLSQRNVRRTELEEAIQTLPANERLLFLLRDVEGYSPAAISGLLGMTEAQVNRALLSARIRLRRALAAGSDANSSASSQSANVFELPVPALNAEQDAA